MLRQAWIFCVLLLGTLLASACGPESLPPAAAELVQPTPVAAIATPILRSTPLPTALPTSLPATMPPVDPVGATPDDAAHMTPLADPAAEVEQRGLGNPDAVVEIVEITDYQ